MINKSVYRYLRLVLNPKNPYPHRIWTSIKKWIKINQNKWIWLICPSLWMWFWFVIFKKMRVFSVLSFPRNALTTHPQRADLTAVWPLTLYNVESVYFVVYTQKHKGAHLERSRKVCVCIVWETKSIKTNQSICYRRNLDLEPVLLNRDKSSEGISKFSLN